MAQTHYIEIDEEIISTVGRLRKSSEAENIFIFPKRALILQSIVNLKLLGREAKKLGKTISVVTQDAEGQLLAEKAGLLTQPYREDTSSIQAGEAATARFTIRHGESIPMPVETKERDTRPPHSAQVGSAEFYNGPREGIGGRSSFNPPPQITPPQGQPLRIRNASPPEQTSLNSIRTRENEQVRQMNEQARNQSIQKQAAPPVPIRPALPPSNMRTPYTERQEKLHRFLSGSRTPTSTAVIPNREAPVVSPVSTPLPRTPEISRLAPWAFIVLGCISAIAIVGAAVFVFLPKAEVIIIPQGATESFKYEFIGTSSAPKESDTAHAISARVVEMEKTIALSIEATGEESGGSAKAQGNVIITNDFSSASQPLVATTRLATADGKIFRLIEGVTVPGVSTLNGEREPGVIEVKVIADQAGDSYNIPPAEFKIPGFQGTPKFDAFTAKSSKAMTGGGAGSGERVKLVAQADLDQAKIKVETEARARLNEEVNASLASGEKILEESVELTVLGTPSAPPAGSVAESFDYQTRFKVRAFVIREQAIRDFLSSQSITSNQAESVVLKPVSYDLVYGKPLTNFTEGRVEFSVQTEMVLRAPIDTDGLRQELLGQDEDGIRVILEKHPEVKRLRVDFKPKIFIASIPDNPERVTLIVTDEE